MRPRCFEDHPEQALADVNSSEAIQKAVCLRRAQAEHYPAWGWGGGKNEKGVVEGETQVSELDPST